MNTMMGTNMTESSTPVWRRHKRPQSMMALQFSAALDDLFKMDNGLDSLVSTVEDKRRSVFVQSRELEELQEQIRAAEARLKQSGSEPASPELLPQSTSSDPLPAEPSIFATMQATTPDTPYVVEATQPALPKEQSPAIAKYEYPMVRRPRARGRRRRLADLLAEAEEEEEEDHAEASSSEGAGGSSEATDSATDSGTDSTVDSS